MKIKQRLRFVPCVILSAVLLFLAGFNTAVAAPAKAAASMENPVLRDAPVIIEKSLSTGFSFLQTRLREHAHLGRIRKEAPPVRSRSRRAGDARRWKLSSRGGNGNYPYMDMEATGYDPGPISCGPHATGRTYTGMVARHGVVAVDPRVIPLGTRVYIDGYGQAIAADIGSAIKGNRIDLCFNTYGEAIRFGRRQIRVYLLGR